MNARAYYRDVQTVIDAASSFVIVSNVTFNEIDTNECYIRGTLTLVNRYELHIAEYTVTEPVPDRQKYRYHLQSVDGVLVSRWDNVPHHRHIATYPDHRHDANDIVHPSEPMSMEKVIKAIIPLISHPFTD